MSDTAVIEEIHVSLAARRLNLEERKQAFQQAWDRRDELADVMTVRMPRITGDLGVNPFSTIRLPITEPESVTGVVQEARIADRITGEIAQAIERYYLEQGAVPDIALCWAMDLLLMGAPERLAIETDVVTCSVELATESELAHRDGQCIICDVRGL